MLHPGRERSLRRGEERRTARDFGLEDTAQMLREVRRLGKVWCARGSHVCVRGGESEQATRRREEERARPHVAEGKRDTDVEGELEQKVRPAVIQRPRPARQEVTRERSATD